MSLNELQYYLTVLVKERGNLKKKTKKKEAWVPELEETYKESLTFAIKSDKPVWNGLLYPPDPYCAISLDVHRKIVTNGVVDIPLMFPFSVASSSKFIFHLHSRIEYDHRSLREVHFADADIVCARRYCHKGRFRGESPLDTFPWCVRMQMLILLSPFHIFAVHMLSSLRITGATNPIKKSTIRRVVFGTRVREGKYESNSAVD